MAQTNKRDPRKVAITDAATLITDLQTRKRVQIRIPQDGQTVAMNRQSAGMTFANSFPYYAGDLWISESGDPIWGIVAAGTQDVLVWEEE